MRLLPTLLGKLLAALLLAGAAQSHAGDMQTSLDWLKVVAFAGHQTNYSGVFVYQYDNHLESSRITHLAEADTEYEKIESLDGSKREIVRHHGQVWSYINHKMVQVDSYHGRSRFPTLLSEQLSALSKNYRASQAGIERVAGYDTQVILFEPKDNMRYAHKIWVHTDSGLLLKSAVLGEKNKVVEQYSFTQLQIGGKIEHAGLPLRKFKGTQGANLAEAHANLNFAANSGWVVGTLPVGYNKIMEIQRPMHEKHAPVIQMMFSDGLSAISVFIEPDDGDEDDVDGLSSRGAVTLYHRVVDKHLITVVGEVPTRTVVQVFNSVRYAGK